MGTQNIPLNKQKGLDLHRSPAPTGIAPIHLTGNISARKAVVKKDF